MDDVYSISTNNRFALFMDDEDNPGDEVVSPSKAQERNDKQEPKKNERVVKMKNKDAKDRPSNMQNGKKDAVSKRRDGPQVNDRSPNKERPQRTERSGPRDNRQQRGSTSGERREGEKGGDNRSTRPPRNNYRGRLPSRENEGQGTTGTFDDMMEGNRERGQRGTRPFRGGRGGRMGSTGEGRGMARKREFERRSGSDKSSVKAVDKREGGGAHNWGSVKDEVETAADELQGQNNEELTNGEVHEEKKVEGEEKEDGEGEEEESIPELTLDEYKAQQEKKRYKPAFNERKAGENEDPKQWKGAVKYERQEDEFFPGTREEVVKFKTSGRVRTQLQGSFFFKDPVKRGMGRVGGGERRGNNRQDSSEGNYGRGEGRGRGDRRGRGGNNYDRRPNGRRDRDGFNVEDEKDFPSLATVSA